MKSNAIKTSFRQEDNCYEKIRKKSKEFQLNFPTKRIFKAIQFFEFYVVKNEIYRYEHNERCMKTKIYKKYREKNTASFLLYVKNELISWVPHYTTLYDYE